MEQSREEFRRAMFQKIADYSKSKKDNNQGFKEGVVELITDLQGMLASIVTSAALTLNMDREKFVVYINLISTEVKQTALKLYEKQRGDNPG